MIDDSNVLNLSNPSRWFSIFLCVFSPLWLCLTFALLAIRLRFPRPSLRKLCRQPGFISSLSVSLSAPFALSGRWFSEWRAGGWSIRPLSNDFFWALSDSVSPVIFGAWLALAVNRRWRMGKSVIDRLGCFLGFGWIVLSLMMTGWKYIFP